MPGPLLLAATLFLAAVLAASAPPSAGRVRVLTADEAGPALGTFSILDSRSEREFRSGHIPGARRVDWRDFTLEKPGALSNLLGNSAGWGKVPPADARLEARLRALGLSNARPVLVVGAPGGWGEEGRIAWNLLYWGALDVALLDGGMPAWSARPSRPIETGRERASAGGNADAKPGDFALAIRPERRIEMKGMKAVVDERSRPILDVRTNEEYAGEKMTGQARGGHLPGARLVVEKALYRTDGRYVDAADLTRLTGLAAGSPSPAVYCVGGVRSALLALLLEARLGVVAANYDGSIWEWSATKELPLVTP